MNVYGRILKVNKKSTLLWQNGKRIRINISSKHNIGDIIDKNDNLLTKCNAKYDYEKDKHLFTKMQRKFAYIKKIRKFFDNAGFLEVVTPKLKNGILQEANISLIKTPYGYLTPSPEVEIKKLISIGFDKVFELCFAYRNDEANSLHKREFLILEWYRPLETPQKITEDFIELVKYLNGGDTLEYLNLKIDLNKIDYKQYKELFLEYVGLDIDNFDKRLVKKELALEGDLDRLEILDAVFALKIEKNLGLKNPVVVYNFPYERAALSKIKNGYAQRFETYIAGVELANCYEEENSYDEIKKRFENTDKEFFEAMKKGIPPMSGIAVGIERVIMLLENETHIL